MSVLFPNFKAANCTNFVACDSIGEAPKEFISWLKKKDAIVVRIRVDGAFYFARMFGNYRSGGRKHFHVEFQSADYFSQKPKTQGSVKKFSEILKLADAAKADVRVVGTFLTTRDRLPEGGIIRTLSAETTAAGVSMQLTQGALKLKNSVVSRLVWIESSPDMLAISVEANKTVRINSAYFGDIFAWILNLYELSGFNETKVNSTK